MEKTVSENRERGGSLVTALIYFKETLVQGGWNNSNKHKLTGDLILQNTFMIISMLVS